jgi:hypothetical protein
MKEPSVLGNTVVGSVRLTPELTLAVCPDSAVKECLQPVNNSSDNFGQTHTPVHILPSLDFDMQPQTSPLLVLSVRVQQHADGVDVAFDMCRLFGAINQLEVKLGGAGLTLHEANGREPTVHTEQLNAAILLIPTEANDAAGRLARVVESLRDKWPRTNNLVVESLEIRGPG